MVETTAVNLPADGTVENDMDKDVAVAAVTVPTAPLLNTTVLSPAVVLKPVPLMVMVVVPNAMFVALWVTTGRTTATCTAVPLFCELVVTEAVKLPATVGLVENVTVRLVVVAPVTVPTAPLLNVTELFAATELKPTPLITTVFAVIDWAVVDGLTVGTIVATWTAAPLVRLLVVTMAVRLPTLVGRVVKISVREVAVADVTRATAPFDNRTVLLAAMVSKPKPLMVRALDAAP